MEKEQSTIPIKLEKAYTPRIDLSELTSDADNKLIIPDEVEKTIRNLCALSPNKEWSGILFYTFEGDYNRGLTITCKSILLLNQGDTATTEFDASNPEIARFMFANGLLGCCTGLIHSHHSMRTFFSGTDRNTLLKEGADCNNFLSLIVNNEGTYTAAITRRVELENSVSKKVTTTGKYPLFNTGVEVLMPRQEDKSSYKETVISIEFLYLTIEKNDNIEASPECEAFNKVTTIPYFQKYASSSTEAVNNWYNKSKSYSTTPYQPYKPFEGTPKSGKGNYYGSLFKEYGLEEQEEHIPESFKGLTDEEEDILKTECSKINWNDSFYLLFMEKLFFGSPFIVKAHCSDFKSEVDYIAKNFDAVCKRTFSVLDMKTWFESSADFYVYETDFPTIDDEPDFEVYFDAFAPTVYRIVQAFEPYRGKSEYIDMACKILSAKL